MSRTRSSSLTAGLLRSLTAAGTVWAAMLSWRGFTELPEHFLFPLLVVGVVIAVSGTLARWWHVPGPLVVLVQAVLGTAVVCVVVTGVPLPGPALLAELDAAVSSANEYASPVPSTDDVSVQALLVVGGLITLLLVDVLACTLRRVPLAGLPLLAIYSVPVSLLDQGLSWWVFALTAWGFISLLYLHESDQINRWGRTLGASPEVEQAGFGVRTGAIRASAGLIGGVATATAVVVPLLIPTLSLEVFDFGEGSGGDSSIEIENPMVDLRRDLRRGPDVPLIRVTTDDPDPDYLRISVLNRFSQNAWTSGDRDVPTSNAPDGEMPQLEGVSPTVPRTEYSYDVEVDDAFRSTWLPTQAPIAAIDAPGDWRFDDSTMDFISSDDDLTAAGTSYAMTAVELDLDAAELATAPATVTGIADEVRDLPQGLPSLVSDLAIGVTSEAPTRFQKAVALQSWFRERGGFTYSLRDSETGNGVDELEAFLTEGEDGRTGYCEQFAAAMAVMARVIDIPSRVAVGFLQPDLVGQDTYEYSADDLHAWPELYFPGAGWVRFDPTPPDRVAAVPDYTTEDVEVGTPSALPSEQPSAQPSGRPTTAPSQAPSDAPADQGDEASGGSGGASLPWTRILVGLVVAALVAVALVLPRATRRRRREERLALGAEEAWDELRATVMDLRHSWPEGRSPGETRDHLVQLFGSPGDDDPPERPARGPDRAPDAVDALDRIVHELELTRYSRVHTTTPGQLHDDVLSCCAALEAGVTRRTLRQAEWLPRSVLRRRRAPRSSPARGPEVDSSGSLVEHL